MPRTRTPNRTVAVHHHLASSGQVIQRARLNFQRLITEQPTIILVESGYKTFRWSTQECRITAGNIVAIAGGQAFDILIQPDTSGAYRARWISFAPELIALFRQRYGSGTTIEVLVQPSLDSVFQDTFCRINQQLATQTTPPDILEIQLMELLARLKQSGNSFTPLKKPSLSEQIRHILSTDLTHTWTLATIAKQCHMSIATLHRKLQAEKTTFRELLIDVRMTHALILLQATDWSIMRIANETGYDSPSRFTARFRSRFGFAPTAIRGT
ncbi:MAG: AraC family transcriptional regulator [Cardiobacteriaceae bacterium]|nr:AraC family transcriptional regulator [Cardiobacteriaceae bacterium]